MVQVQTRHAIEFHVSIGFHIQREVYYNLTEPIRMPVKEDSETSTLRKKTSCKECKGIRFQKKDLSNIKHNKEKV